LEFSESITAWHTTKSIERRHCNVRVLGFDTRYFISKIYYYRIIV
jgi:hypothetical protein